MRSYETEIVIPQDRSICLQLPESLPTGRALVTIMVTANPDELDLEPSWEEQDQGLDPDAVLSTSDLDRQDIEWWDEFEERGADEL